MGRNSHFDNMIAPLIAHIPVSLTDLLRPEELSELMEVVKSDNVEPETVILRGVRDYLQRRRDQARQDAAAA